MNRITEQEEEKVMRTIQGEEDAAADAVAEAVEAAEGAEEGEDIVKADQTKEIILQSIHMALSRTIPRLFNSQQHLLFPLNKQIWPFRLNWYELHQIIITIHPLKTNLPPSITLLILQAEEL